MATTTTTTSNHAAGEAAIHTLLDDFAKAFTKGDGKGAAACWEVPALIVSDDGTKAVASLDEVGAFFGGAAKQYTDKGTMSTRADVQSITWITDKVATVQVRWPYLDKDGKAQGTSESSTYVMRFVDDDTPKINTTMMAGASDAKAS